MSSFKPSGEPGLFRERAISALDSVERFDEAIEIVSARSIAALAVVAAVLLGALIWAIFGRVPVGLQGRGIIATGGGAQAVTASSGGTLIALPGEVGDSVAEGFAVARLRTTTGAIVALRAPVSGKLAQRSPQLGSYVAPGEPVATIEPAAATPTAVIFVPVETDRRVASGMAVRLSPADSRSDVFGFLRGHVIYAAPYPASADRIKAALQNDAIAASFSADVAVREVRVAIDVDAAGNPIWSGAQSGRRPLSPGMPCYATIVVEERHPISFVLPQTHG